MKKHLRAKNSELEEKNKEIVRLRRLLDIQNSSIKELESKLKMKRLAEGVSGDSDDDNSSNRDLKFKINEMIKEVDRITTLLHQ
ncbi:MAG: hypothetical protein IT245_06155 [Bacteroidia bacterium]|nr:hypothetical protein [Bacteroidia bacterium]